jgi:hypothetical protein
MYTLIEKKPKTNSVVNTWSLIRQVVQSLQHTCKESFERK